MKYLVLIAVLSFTQVSYSATVTGDKINVRSVPSLKAKKTGVQLSRGDKVSLTNDSYHVKPKTEKIVPYGTHPWWHVSFEKNGTSNEGYVFGAFMIWEIVKNCGIHVKPDEKSKRIKKLKTGDKVEVLEVTEPVDDTAVPYWCFVKDSTGVKGWVYFDYVQ